MCDEDRRAIAAANAQGGAWVAEQMVWQAVGGIALRGLGAVGRMVLGPIGSRFAPTVDALGTTVAGQAFKNAIRQTIPVYEFPFLGRSGAYLPLCRVIVVGSSAPKWVWLEEFAHSLQPALRYGAKGVARLQAEVEVKVNLVRNAVNYGLNKNDVAEILDTLEGYFKAHRAGAL
jgi:hypothetical protein